MWLLDTLGVLNFSVTVQRSKAQRKRQWQQRLEPSFLRKENVWEWREPAREKNGEIRGVGRLDSMFFGLLDCKRAFALSERGETQGRNLLCFSIPETCVVRASEVVEEKKPQGPASESTNLYDYIVIRKSLNHVTMPTFPYEALPFCP